MVGRGCRLVLIWACLVAAGCSAGGGPSGRADSSDDAWATGSSTWPGASSHRIVEHSTSWWPVASTSELSATGIDVAAMSGVESLVVDGVGAAWVAGPWSLTRVDPATGYSDSWDVSDDITFATKSAVRPARSGGVWLVLDDRLRLFDGERFARDLPVPAAFRGGEGSSVNDMLEVGPEVWISSPSGVARCTGESWALVGAGQAGGAGPMALDAGGHVWALAQDWTENGFVGEIMRFDGTSWSRPDAAGTPADVSQIVAEPDGGILARTGARVFRFDGFSWRELSSSAGQDVGERGLRSLAVAPGGELWALGPDGLAAARGAGPWRRVVGIEGAPVGLGISGDQLLVAHSTGLSRLEDDRLEPIWTASGVGPEAPVADVVAVSADEVWVRAAGSLWRVRGGQWQAVAEDRVPWSRSDADVGPLLLRATDGAIWAINDPGVVRYTGEDRVVVPRDRPDERLLVGPEGSVWAVETRWPGWSAWYAGDKGQGRTVTLVGADGSQTGVQLPGVAWSLTSLAAGVDGSLWAVICAEDRSDYCTEPDLMRWDGAWAPVPYPGVRPVALAVASDGALWATLEPGDGPRGQQQLARHWQGRWARLPDVSHLRNPVLAPDGSICGVRGGEPAMVCADGDGSVRTFPLGVPGRISIGQDGSVWLADRGQLAQLSIRVTR